MIKIKFTYTQTTNQPKKKSYQKQEKKTHQT